MILSKADLLKSKLRTEQIEAFGGEVVIRELPVARLNGLLKQFVNDRGEVDLRIDEVMLPMFMAGMAEPEFDAEDTEALAGVSGAEVQRVALAIMRLNGLTSDAMDDARGES